MNLLFVCLFLIERKIKTNLSHLIQKISSALPEASETNRSYRANFLVFDPARSF